MTLHAIALRFELRLPGCRSLKEKRARLARLRRELRQHFDVSMAEVDHQDLPDRATWAVALVSGDGATISRVALQLEKLVGAWPEAELLDVGEAHLVE